MSNKFNDLQPRYDRDESPREWDKPPIAVVCVRTAPPREHLAWDCTHE